MVSYKNAWEDADREMTNLKHDIDRHIKIGSDLANQLSVAMAENARLKAAQQDGAWRRTVIMDAIEQFMDPSHFDHDGDYLHCPDANRGFYTGDLADAIILALEQKAGDHQ